MSMMGRFVQVSPDLLKEIIGDPSGVEELFISEQAAKAMPQLAGALGALQGRPTKLLAASMASLNHVATSSSVLRARELGCWVTTEHYAELGLWFRCSRPPVSSVMATIGRSVRKIRSRHRAGCAARMGRRPTRAAG